MNIKKNNSNKNIALLPKLNFRWLTFLLLLTLFLALIQALMMIVCYKNSSLDAYYTVNVFQIASGFAYIGIIILTFFFPSVLYGLSPFVNSAIQNTSNDELDLEKKTQANSIILQNLNIGSKFDDAYLNYIESSVTVCMKQSNIFLEKNFNIGSLAKLIKVPAHHLSFYFKEVRKQSFNDFRNQMRIEFAKKLIKENSNQVYTLEAIGHLSGFSSKNAFFTAFKKFEKTTPGKYARSLT